MDQSSHSASAFATPPLGGLADSERFQRQLLSAMVDLRDGNFTARLPVDLTGLDGKIADVFNEIAAISERRALETARVSRAVGKEGKLKQRMSVPGVAGGWAEEVAAVNTLIDDLVWPTTEVTRAVGAVAKGDLGQAMALEVDGRPLEGEFLRSARLVNKMIDQLSVFTSEVTRVAREVGTEGKLGGQAQVKGVSGVWKELTESVNQMAGNLTAQVRNIAEVTIAVANGHLSKKITVDVRGEILQLKEAINTMVDAPPVRPPGRRPGSHVRGTRPWCAPSGLNDGFTGLAPDLGALELGCPPPVYGPRPEGSESFTPPIDCGR
jgi:HAMP domain-containing protein